MSRGKFCLDRGRASLLFLDWAKRRRNRVAVPTKFGRAIFSIGCLVAFCAASLVLNSELARAAQTDFSEYARAADYCRGNVLRPMALSPDKRILCFDGEIPYGQEPSPAKALEDGGLFVVRSEGGDGWAAMNLAGVLEERHAVVVVYGYCVSACADYLLFASAQAFVLRDAVVAWHDTTDPHFCPVLVDARDRGPKRLGRTVCPDAPAKYQDMQLLIRQTEGAFFSTRITDADFEMPPESVVMRRRLRSFFEETGTYPVDLMWTWNPRSYSSVVKTRVIYERYPESQEALDVILSGFGWRHVIYDP